MLIGKDIYSQLFFYGNCIIQCTYLHNLWLYFSNLKLASNLVLGLYMYVTFCYWNMKKLKWFFFFCSVKNCAKIVVKKYSSFANCSLSFFTSISTYNLTSWFDVVIQKWSAIANLLWFLRQKEWSLIPYFIRYSSIVELQMINGGEIRDFKMGSTLKTSVLLLMTS